MQLDRGTSRQNDGNVYVERDRQITEGWTETDRQTYGYVDREMDI
jgi:hypothetical protein